MATRARIGFETQVGEIVSSYHHWDGYPAGLGYNLIKNYAGDRDKFMEAVMLGDASNWGSKVHPSTSQHSFQNAEDDVNVYYGRDRGEDNTAPVTFTDFADFVENWNIAGEEYAYVLRLDGTLTMIERYADNAVVEDAEDEIIIARADAIKSYRNRLAA